VLIEHDEELVGQCDLMRSMADQQSGAATLEKMADLESGLEEIRASLLKRDAVLHERM